MISGRNSEKLNLAISRFVFHHEYHPVLNPVFRNEVPVSNRLSYGTIYNRSYSLFSKCHILYVDYFIITGVSFSNLLLIPVFISVKLQFISMKTHLYKLCVGYNMSSKQVKLWNLNSLLFMYHYVSIATILCRFLKNKMYCETSFPVSNSGVVDAY